MGNINKKIIAGIAILALAAILLFGVWRLFGPSASSGLKDYALIVVDDNGSEKEYSGKTESAYLLGLMDELVKEGDFSYTGHNDTYGIYIDSVNGLTADYDTDKAYWAIYVNGEYGQYGAGSQPVSDGDVFKLVYEPAG